MIIWRPITARLTEIVAQPTEQQLGGCFELREFNSRVFDTGIVPLSALRAHIKLWISSKQCPQLKR